MQCIVPLAGPDFYSEAYGVRSLLPIDGVPLLARTLEARPWWTGASDSLIFVVRESPGLGEILQFIRVRYPESRTVTLSHLTQGALFSALAGVPLEYPTGRTLCVDLVDILYDAPELTLSGLARRFELDSSLGGVIPYFESTEPCYSYLDMLPDGSVLATVEKRVISSHASAGTYFFRDSATFLSSIGHYLSHDAEQLTVKGIHFLCPLYNATIGLGRKVLGVEVQNAQSYSKSFHDGTTPAVTAHSYPKGSGVSIDSLFGK